MITRQRHGSPHTEGDGCTGQPRPLTSADADDLRGYADRMARLAHAGNYDAVATLGEHIALHYGPPGEWALTLYSFDIVRLGRGGSLVTRLGAPRLVSLVPLDDDRAAALLDCLISRQKPIRSPLDEQDGAPAAALNEAALAVQSLSTHLYTGNHREARRTWAARPRHDHRFTAYLVTWAAASLTGTAPAVPASHPTE